jgi:hypothetical protein
MKNISLTAVLLVISLHFLLAQNTFPSSGNVGIGTTSPSFNLQVQGSANIAAILNSSLNSTSTSGETSIYLGDPGSGVNMLRASKRTYNTRAFEIWTEYGYSTPFKAADFYYNYLNFYTSNVNRLTIDNNGYVGIGTSTPLTPFDVKMGTNQHIQFVTAVNGYYSGVPGIIALNDSNTGYTPLGFFASNYYFGGGNIGINTTSPLGSLDVKLTSNQHIQFTPNVNSAYSGASGIVCINDGNTGYTPLGFYASNYYFGLGNVGIGTTDTKGYTFAVNGTAIATAMTVKAYGNWPDYVFNPTYHLCPLNEVKTYIDQNQHLPDMPSAEEVVKDGINLGEMNKLLTKKVEELTLYLIEKDNKDKEKDTRLNAQQEEINRLKQQLDAIATALKKN